MHQIRCAEIWGGNRPVDTSICTSGLTASILSRVCDGDAGGDIYYFSVCSYDKLTRIAIADLRGHGDAASLLSGWLYQALEDRMNSLDGAGILAELNNIVLQRGFQAITTAVIASYYIDDSKVYFSYAGHPPILVGRRESGWSSLQIEAAPGIANLPLGVTPNVRYDQCEVLLRPGDRLFLYTDGISERANPEGDLYGLEKLTRILTETAGQSLELVKSRLLEDLNHHSAGLPPDDDSTLLVVEVAPALRLP